MASTRGPGRPKGKFTQHRRIDRLRTLLEQHPKGMTLYELADALNVTARSMRRYLREVERDIELISAPDKPGGPLRWRIDPSAVPRKIELRRTQAYALLAARRVFEPMRGSTLFEEIDMATKRLVSIARRPGRGPNAGVADARLEDRFLYLPHSPKDYRQKTEELDDLFQAVADLRPLRCRYRRGSESNEERITIYPYAMVLYREAIYCVGLHVQREEIRTFLLDRMRDTEVSATERFELPADFHIDDYFQGQFGIWRGTQSIKVVVDFDAKVAEYVRSRKVHSSQKLQSIAGGGVRLSMTLGNLNPVVSWALEWGPRAKVVEPPELVERVRAELDQALAQYKKKRSKK